MNIILKIQVIFTLILSSLNVIYQDKKVAVIYKEKDIVLEMIEDKIDVDYYCTSNTTNYNLEDYDLIIAGSSIDILDDLKNYQFHSRITSYYIGIDRKYYEDQLSNMYGDLYFPGVYFNDDELSEIDYINSMVDAWLTSSLSQI